MKSQINPKTLPAFFYKLLGPAFASSVASTRLARRFNPPMIHFPAALSAVTKLIIIMPDDPIDALHRIPLCIALLGRFKGASFTLLCTTEWGPYLKGLQDWYAWRNTMPRSVSRVRSLVLVKVGLA